MLAPFCRRDVTPATLFLPTWSIRLVRDGTEKGRGGGGGAFWASIVEGEAKSAAGAMKVIEIL